MKKSITFLVAILLLSQLAVAGKPKKIFYKEQTIETPEATIAIVDGVSEEDYIKFKLKIKNKTSDALLLKTSDVVLILDGKEVRAEHEKSLIIAPNDDASRVIDIKGDYRVGSFSVRVEGLSRAKTLENSLHAPDFHLPATTRSFNVGAFGAVLDRDVRTTDLVDISFKTTYSGAMIGLIDPSKIGLKLPNGKVFANMRGNQKMMIMEPGMEKTLAMDWKKIPVREADTQFSELEILFRDAFKEAEVQSLKAPLLKLETESTK